MEEQLSWDFDDDNVITIQKELLVDTELESLEIDVDNQTIVYRFYNSNDTYLSTGFSKVVIK